MVFSIFTELCNHHYQIPEHSHHPKNTSLTPISLQPLQPHETIDLCAISLDLSILDISYKWDQTT